MYNLNNGLTLALLTFLAVQVITELCLIAPLIIHMRGTPLPRYINQRLLLSISDPLPLCPRTRRMPPGSLQHITVEVLDPRCRL